MELIESIRQHIRSHELECGSNKKLAWKHAGAELQEWFLSGKVDANKFSLNAIAEATIPGYNGMKNSSAEELSEAMVTSAFPNVTGSLIHSRIIDAYNYELGSLRELITEDTATDYPDSRLVGFGAGDDLDYIPEGKEYEDTILTEKNIQVRIGKFGKIIELTREMVLFDKTNQAVARARAIGEKAGSHQAKMIVQTIEMLPRTCFGETTSNLRNFVYDGSVTTVGNFYNTDHSSVLDKRVNSNKITTALTTAGMNEAYALLAQMVDERGTAISIRPTHILIHPTNEATLDQLLHSQQQHDTAENALNPYGPGGLRSGLQPVSSVFISDADDWYLGRFSNQVTWLWGWKPETLAQGATSDSAFSRDVVNRFRFGYMGGCAHQDYRYIINANVA